MSTHIQIIYICAVHSTFSPTVLQIGFTPLHYASQNGHTDVVELLIDHDAHIDVPTKVGVGAHNTLYSH